MRRSAVLRFILVVFCGALVLVSTQETPQIPSIACPDNFAYLRYGNEYIARVTVPNVGHGTTRLDVQLTQRESVPTNYSGNLSLYQDQKTTLNNINNGLPVSYRLDFPIPNILPKLLRISLNGDEICASADPSLGTMFSLQHELQTPLQPLSAVSSEGPAPAPIVFKDAITGKPLPPTKVTTTSLSDNVKSTPQSQNLSAQCGFSRAQQSIRVHTFIFSGDTGDQGDYPWLVAVYKKQKLALKLQCVGSLISERSIITSAHCFAMQSINVSQFVAYLGGYDLDNYDESDTEVRDIENLIIHPDFNAIMFSDADLAILKMKTVVRFTEFISPVCVWSESTDSSLIVGNRGSILGWGFDQETKNLSGVPHLETGVIVSNEDCARSLGEDNRFASPRTICLRNHDGSGPCSGEAGGALMFKRHDVWMLRGVLSAGQFEQGRCKKDGIVIFCDLAKHLTWIGDNLV